MLDIIVPVYNEGLSILRLFDEIKEKIKTSKRVFIVYDFTQDTTVPVVKENCDKYPFEIILHLNTLGRGALNAIKSGMFAATNEKILVMMADSSDNLNVVDSMCSLMDQGYDLVCGSRYMRGGKQYGGPKFKTFLSKFAGKSLHFITGLPTHDATNSFKLYRKSMISTLNIESKGGFEIGLEIVVKAFINGFKIAEIPSEWYDRTDGESHFHLWKWLPHYLYWYLWCIWYRFIRIRRKNDRH